jgi:hypothetical protein
MIMGDRRGISPSNVDQGYVLRRLIAGNPFWQPAGRAENSLCEIARVSSPSTRTYIPKSKKRGVYPGAAGAWRKAVSTHGQAGIREFGKVLERMKARASPGWTA